mmetsp:Transcript_120086/g.345238  ORF Transcript_120086/g.345238 Transcript_120086/m.345238 type:complete len:223 (-) Transcript_120086:5-673(-)
MGQAARFTTATKRPAGIAPKALIHMPDAAGAKILQVRSMRRNWPLSNARSPGHPADKAAAHWFSTETLLAKAASFPTHVSPMVSAAPMATAVSVRSSTPRKRATLKAAKAMKTFWPAKATNGAHKTWPRPMQRPILDPRSAWVNIMERARAEGNKMERLPPSVISSSPAENSHMRSPQAEAKCDVTMSARHRTAATSSVCGGVGRSNGFSMNATARGRRLAG